MIDGWDDLIIYDDTSEGDIDSYWDDDPTEPCGLLAMYENPCVDVHPELKQRAGAPACADINRVAIVANGCVILQSGNDYYVAKTTRLERVLWGLEEDPYKGNGSREL